MLMLANIIINKGLVKRNWLTGGEVELQFSCLKSLKIWSAIEIL